MEPLEVLDNPVLWALSEGHRPLAQSAGLASRYPASISPFVGLREPTAKAFSDLLDLVPAGDTVALLSTAPIDVPHPWQTLRSRTIEQMVCTELSDTTPIETPRTLDSADVPEMLALTAATEPGPFLPETIRIGHYVGIRSADGRLAAMAGERLSLDSFTEISAVCTDPDFRGHGYGLALVRYLTDRILRQGRVAFLHVKNENRAKALYERIGFQVRRAIVLTVVARGGDGDGLPGV